MKRNCKQPSNDCKTKADQSNATKTYLTTRKSYQNNYEHLGNAQMFTGHFWEMSGSFPGHLQDISTVGHFLEMCQTFPEISRSLIQTYTK